ncbi:TNT domain-containing protein [Aspergillus niger CBS 101883]|uniref:TNT domain-containing protein n=1 Tax=Aspergillus lacticoffeatus (strain CBS 101883) TaxID=1450533 RepID=UPI000D7ECB16|nr:uncharacterized protein BO96DRAFT_452713 [Aspergillus niger CBS 101883]PYH62996.1 hypothetical protein BO96DRAFT_452713 [Aspergillus niger CBS 101883]
MVRLARVALLLVPLLGTFSHAIQAEDYPESCTNPCDGLIPDRNITNQEPFHCDYCICKNKLLGWSNIQIPANFTTMFDGWQALGGQCPKDWLCTWANWATYQFDSTNNKLVYAPNNGFNGCPQTVTLPVGTLVDRFGTENGSYLAPEGTPYAERSIGPGSLNKYNKSTEFNYWKYIVRQPFQAQAGSILPWASQPGGGQQYYVKGGLAPLRDAGKLELIAAETYEVDEAWEAAQALDGDYPPEDE